MHDKHIPPALMRLISKVKCRIFKENIAQCRNFFDLRMCTSSPDEADFLTLKVFLLKEILFADMWQFVFCLYWLLTLNINYELI